MRFLKVFLFLLIVLGSLRGYDLVFASDLFPLNVISVALNPKIPKQEKAHEWQFHNGKFNKAVWSSFRCKEESFDGMSTKCRQEGAYKVDYSGVVILKGKRWYAFYDNISQAIFSPDRKFFAVWNTVLQRDGSYVNQRKIVRLKDKKVTLLPFKRCTQDIYGWEKDFLITLSQEGDSYDKDGEFIPNPPLPEICIWDTKGNLSKMLIMNKYNTATTTSIANKMGFLEKEKMTFYMIADLDHKLDKNQDPDSCEIVVIDLLNPERRMILSFPPGINTSLGCISIDTSQQVDMSQLTFENKEFLFRRRADSFSVDGSYNWLEWQKSTAP